MVVQTSEDTPREGSEAPAMITPDIISPRGSDATEVESNDSSLTPSVILMEEEEGREESPEVKRATERIVSNAVSIDVLLPQNVREESEKKHCPSGSGSDSDHFTKMGEKLMDKDEESKGGNEKKGSALGRYFQKKTKGLTRTQIAILCIFPFVEFFAATVISIQGPFYPKVAREKGVTPPEYGLVFGSFEIVVFIMAPIYGAKMGMLNPHRLFNYGIFTTSISCILFGFVNYINNRVGFFMISLIIRVIEAIGDAAFVTASFSIIAIEFPDSVATTFAMMETFYGLGMIAGPTVGGALFGIGGFTLPFGVMGGLLLISAVATYHYITRVSTADANKIVSSSSFGMFKMLKIPAIALTAYGTFAAATGIGFLVNNLEHHLEHFELSEFQVGSIFMLNGGVYALSAPLWGRFCDNSKELKVYSVIGSLLTICGFMLVGPLPFFSNWSPSIPVICIGLVIFGLGLGSTLVSAFVQFLHDALANGHPEDVTTHGLVSGLWTSMTALGFFIGPTVGGFLDHVVGFRWGTLFILLEQFVLIGLLVHYFLKIRKSPTTPEETSSPEDNMDDIVITYALKMNTPKPKPRKKSPSKRLQQELDRAAEAGVKIDSDTNTNSVFTDSEDPTVVVVPKQLPTEVPQTPPQDCENAEHENVVKSEVSDTPKLSVSSILADESTIRENLVESNVESSSSDNKASKGLENPGFVGDP